MTQWPHDDTASKNAFYGDFHSPGWQDVSLVHMVAPFVMYYSKQPLTHGILVHRKIVPPLMAIFAAIWEQCGQSQAAVDATGISDWGGCFNIRPIAGTNSWSNHSWACAVASSPSTTGFTVVATTIAHPASDAFTGQGALWGGDYTGRKDPMHFEFVSR